VLITNHVLSGAAIGALSPDPISAAGRGFVSHFVLDSLPHFGLPEEHLMRIAVPDGLVGLVTIGVVAREAPAGMRLRVLGGIFGACLPDIDKPARQFFGRSPFPRWFDRVHSAIQPEASHRLPIELAAGASFAAALTVLLRQPGATSRSRLTRKARSASLAASSIASR
jgi:hypothetical protein